MYLCSPGLFEKAGRDDRKSDWSGGISHSCNEHGIAMEQGLGSTFRVCITAGEVFELRECIIRLGVTGFDPSVYQVGRDVAVLSNKFFPPFTSSRCIFLYPLAEVEPRTKGDDFFN